MLIIDCHGHYTTAPEPHQKFRDAQLVRIKDSTLAAPVPQRVSDDEIRETLETNQLRLQRERGADLTLFSPRASAMGHHVGDESVSLGVDARLQRSRQTRRRPVSRRTSPPSASCRSRPECRSRIRSMSSRAA